MFYNYFPPLTILATMLQVHLQLMTSSSYTLRLFSSIIMSICPINCEWNQTWLHLEGVKIVLMVYISVLRNFWKVYVLLFSYIKGIMGVCFHWCIYKVVFSLNWVKIITCLYMVVYLPSLFYQPIYLYVYLPIYPRVFTYLKYYPLIN
jgi:hypothetical protein